MLRQELQLAKELINEMKYDKARQILQTIPSDPVASEWLKKLDAIAPLEKKMKALMDSPSVEPGAWQYAALEARRSYGIQYKVNGESKPEWKDQPIFFPLNLLGQEGWELVTFESREEFSTYILKKPGVGEAKKIEVWDQ